MYFWPSLVLASRKYIHVRRLVTVSGADLGGGRRGCTTTHPLPRDEAFFVFVFNLFLPHQSVTPFHSGAPPKKYPGSAPEVVQFLTGLALRISERLYYKLIN